MIVLQAAGYPEQRAETRLSGVAARRLAVEVSRVRERGYPANPALALNTDNRTSGARPSGEAPPGLPVEGVLNGNIRASASEAVSGEAPRTLFAEGVLNPNDSRASGSEAVSGEAPRTLFAEGVLNPDNCVLNPDK